MLRETILRVVRGCSARFSIYLSIYLSSWAPAPVGKFVLFLAWLPHRTMLEEKEEVAASGEGAVSGDARDVGDACHRLHHTAYVRAGTEVAACVMHTYLTRPASTKDVPWPCRAC